MTKKYIIDVASKSDCGRVRVVNEDSIVVLNNKFDDYLLLVADGLGGHNRGDYASKLASNYISEEFRNRKRAFSSIIAVKIWLKNRIIKANKLVYDQGESAKENKGMGTTLICVLLHGNSYVLLNIGDSSLFSFCDNQLKKISQDQSLVEYLKNSKQITEEEALHHSDKNILMNALGVFPSVSFDTKTISYHNEGLLLCSDGLTNNLNKKDIIRILSSNKTSSDIVDTLIEEANNNGGSDNISVIYFKRNNL